MSLLPTTLFLPQQTIAKSRVAFDLTRMAVGYGLNGVIVHGHSLKHNGMLDAILANMPLGMTVRTWCHVGNEPTIASTESLRADLRANRPDWVAAVGGGSVMDLAKAAAGLIDAPEHTLFYQKNIQLIPTATLPFIAVPTTAGTGSEATFVAVLTDTEHTVKQSIRHPSFMPRMVLLDPALLKSCPPYIIATAGLDAFVQAFESLTSIYATPFTRSLSELALTRIAQALLPLYHGDQREAAGMLEASYLAGLAFSQARLGVVHGLAHPLGARLKVAHGLVCAYCFPACLAFNRDVIKPDLAMLKSRYGLDVETCVQTWLTEMKLDNPFIGKPIHDRETVIREILASGSTAANPRAVTPKDASMLLDAIFH